MTEAAARARDAAIALVHTDIAKAEARAAAVDDPWYRAQALAWVARYAPEHDVIRIARRALQAAADCADPYQQAGSTAWVVRALLERGLRDDALTMLELALQSVPRIDRTASRSEALFLLFQAAFAVGEDVRRSLVFALAEAYDADPHWRVERNFLDALRMLMPVDPTLAEKLARGGDEARRARREEALASGPLAPRVFFV